MMLDPIITSRCPKCCSRKKHFWFVQRSGYCVLTVSGFFSSIWCFVFYSPYHSRDGNFVKGKYSVDRQDNSPSRILGVPAELKISPTQNFSFKYIHKDKIGFYFTMIRYNIIWGWNIASLHIGVWFLLDQAKVLRCFGPCSIC